jgi:hypothetical protein
MLVGFSQEGAFRRFSFQRVVIGSSRVKFDVLADLALAKRCNIGLQELPSLCARRLHATAEDAPADTLCLTEADLCEAAAANAASTAQIAAAHAARSRRASSASAARSGQQKTGWMR